MRLTKTEQAVLEKAEMNPRGVLYAMTWYSTSAVRRRGISGTRAADAIVSLVKKGFAEDLKIESNHGPNSDGWGSTHATEYTAKITDAGRLAIQP